MERLRWRLALRHFRKGGEFATEIGIAGFELTGCRECADAVAGRRCDDDGRVLSRVGVRASAGEGFV